MTGASIVTRPTGWPNRLADLMSVRLHRPFEWGPNDCASYAADAVAAILCADPLAELRGHRLNERQALRREKAIGGIAGAIERAGFQRIDPALAQRGDLVLIAQDPRPVLSVCNGADAMAPGPDGLAFADMARAVAAWRV